MKKNTMAGAFRRESRLLNNLQEPLQADVRHSLEYLKQEYDRYEAGEIELDEFAFWARIATQAFFAYVDGICYAMRYMTLKYDSLRGVQLTNKKRAEIAERKYDKETDTVLDVFKKTPFRRNVTNAITYFPQLFGVEYELDTVRSEGWSALVELNKARNAMTHPKRLEDLFVAAPILHTLHPALVFFSWTMADLLGQCNGKTSRRPDNLPVVNTKQLAEAKRGVAEQPGFYDEVGASFTKSLRALEKMIFTQFNDTSIARKLLGESLNSRGHTHHETQFAIRALVRTTFIQVEGITFAVRRFLEDAEKRDPTRKIALLKNGSVCEMYANALNEFSRTFGNGEVLDCTGPGWQGFKNLHAIRDRMTHPKSPKDLQTPLKKGEKILTSMQWILSTQALLEFNLDESTLR